MKKGISILTAIILALFISSGHTQSCVDSSTMTGSDYGAKINAAYASLPASGGCITVPPAVSADDPNPNTDGTNLLDDYCVSGNGFTCPSGGGGSGAPAITLYCHQFSTPIIFGTTSKPVDLTSANPSQIACLRFTPTSIGTAITFNNGQNGGFGLQNITLIGSGLTATENAASTIGIYLGGTNGSAYFGARNVEVRGFNDGLMFGPSSYIIRWTGGKFWANVHHINYPSTALVSGENLTFDGTMFVGGVVRSAGNHYGVNCLKLSPTGTAAVSSFWSFFNDSFDGCQVVMGAFLTARFYSPHFEDDQIQTDIPFIVQNSTVSYYYNTTTLVNPVFYLEYRKENNGGYVPASDIELHGYSRMVLTEPAQWGGVADALVAIKDSGTANLLVNASAEQIANSAGNVVIATKDGVNIPNIRVHSPVAEQTVQAMLNWTVAGVGNYVDTLITWPNAFQDTNYTVNCTSDWTAYGTGKAVLSYTGKTATAIMVRETNVTPDASGGTANCTATENY